MRLRFIIIFLVAVIIGGGYWYKSTAYICPAPLSYRLGDVDDSFNISNEEALEQLSIAERVWESATNRDLFIYDKDADFAINFIFDERQALSNSETNQRTHLDTKKNENESILQTIDGLQVDYNNLTKTYQGQVAEYETRLNEYNETVSNYNDHGGAPEEAFKELEDEKNALNSQLRELNNSADVLSTLAARINELSDRGNGLVAEYNREVESYNQQFGFSREFTQGDYQGDRINIYKFANERELSSVLAHEFGHALGIDHVEGSSSVMYYLLEETPSIPTLTVSDIEAFIQTCGSGNEFSHRLRRSIRTLLDTFNF